MKRIRGENPNLRQKRILQKNNMNPDDWLVQKVFSDFFVCVNKHDGKEKKAFVEVARI